MLTVAISKRNKLQNIIVLTPKDGESMRWVSQYSNANAIKTDFFEARSTAYAKSSALVDDL